MYGQRKAIAKRTPLRPRVKTTPGTSSTPTATASPAEPGYTSSTPSATEGDTATETDIETETETELDIEALVGGRRRAGHQAQPSNTTLDGRLSPPKPKKPMSEHDLLNKYFRRDTVVLKNIDLFRCIVFPLSFSS
jgi:phosphatidylethanolamine N-methyltransferase